MHFMGSSSIILNIELFNTMTVKLRRAIKDHPDPLFWKQIFDNCFFPDKLIFKVYGDSVDIFGISS